MRDECRECSPFEEEPGGYAFDAQNQRTARANVPQRLGRNKPEGERALKPAADASTVAWGVNHTASHNSFRQV